jgi:hypothetical protein
MTSSRRRRFKAWKKKSKPGQRLEGHTMLYTGYFVDGATHTDNIGGATR